MPAFQAAIERGARHIETDVRVSADAVVHCFHDPLVDRTTSGTGPLNVHTSSDIEELDAGHRHVTADGPVFRETGARIPTFEELVTSFPDVSIVVDMKEDDVVEPLATLVNSMGIGERLIVGGFSDRRIAAFRELTSGRVPTSTGPTETRMWLLASRVGRGYSGSASALQVPRQVRGVKVVDPKLVDAAHSKGLQVHVWTVNEPAHMRELLEMGVDGLVTDRIDLLLDLTGS